jgi:hypothetical protein
MTPELYYEMCEALGTEPIESEIPVGFGELPETVQDYVHIYYLLRDIWDPMGGNYLGKDMSTVFDFFRLYKIESEDQLFALSILQQLDSYRSKILQEKQKQQQALSKQKA